MDTIQDIELLLVLHGQRSHRGLPSASVSALEHALQCAQLAEWSLVDTSMIVAALLHDIGHLVRMASDRRADEPHAEHAARLLNAVFPSAVVEPIRLHVQAKRYLVATDAKYLSRLSRTSMESLGRQGGVMSRGECRRFEAQPYAEDAVTLRRWDDSAKVPGRQTPPLAHYLPLLRKAHTGTESAALHSVVSSLGG